MKYLSASILVLLVCFSLQSQTKVIGKVTDYNQQPQTNVLVYLDTLKTDVKINSRGFFKINVPDGTQNINIFSPKYGLLSSEFSGREKMNFVFLDPSESETSNDLIAVDYNDLSQSNETQNSTSVDLNSNKDVVGYATIFDYIRGKVAGVRVDQSDRIIIRGVRSVTGNSEPLLVVDGMPVDNIAYVDVNQVKDVKVLKNGSSIYGARGANGVLVISLKK